MSIVCKFGGTSLANAENIRKVAEIIKSDNERKFVVVSAPGKRSKDDIKITDCLIECYNLSRKGECYANTLGIIKERFNGLKDELNVKIDLTKDFEELENAIQKHEDYDYIVSRGEYFSARIISKFLGFKFVDASKVIVFDDNGKVDLDTTQEKVEEFITEDYVLVPGFYGVDKLGKIKVFSRGGSDLSGAILANALKCSIYENWTDVDGFLASDPKLIDNPPVIKTLTYHELRELSYMGATVLHPSCTGFLKDKGIAINLRNTFNPESEGSMIVPDDESPKSNTITGIAGQKGFTILHLEKYDLNESLGLIETIAKIFKKHKVSIEHIPTGIDSVSIIFKSKNLKEEVLNEIQNDLIEEIIPDKMQIIESVALISVVGNALRNNFMLERKAFESVFMCDVELLTVNKGAKGMSIIFGVAEENFKQVSRSLFVNLIR